ncbi:HAD hydrolase-like protein, partial [Pinirhizobacter sp.]|uniref:HAD hydrolase-like protein n=1 Tax=Pinirhizobacter sp. TaxID=2950432 RepID=UPI002F40DFD6
SAHSQKASMIAAAIEDFASPRESTVMVGDRSFDIEGAVANHIASVGVLWGFGDEAELTQAGAAKLARHPSELPGLT